MQARSTPTISTVTPTYNRVNLIERAIKSIQQQTYAVHEIIIVDDGSTDGTSDLVARMSENDSRMKLLKRNRGGAPRARNAGVEAASSEWIAFLDSDDYWTPDKMEAQVRSLVKNPQAVASFTGLKNVGDAEERVFLPPDNPTEVQIRASNVLSSTSSALIKKNVFHQVGGFDPDLPSCQDWDLWFRLRRIGPFSVVREPHLLFSSGPHDRISTNYDAVFAGHEVVFKRFLEGVSSRDRIRIKTAHDLTLAALYLKQGRASEALLKASSSLLRRPSKWAIRLSFSAAKMMIAR